MLDLPELLDKALQYLGRHDLTRCAQVNKQWHALTIPHIWCDLTCIYSGNTRGEAFRRIVLEDYQQENGYEEGRRQPSALSKYGHLIRLLPNPMDLERALRSQACTQQGNEPTTHDLLFHLFKRSPKAQVRSLYYRFKDPESDNMKSILEFTLPRLRNLCIEGSLQGTQSEFISFKSALDQCPTTLESLSVITNIQRAVEKVDMQDEATEDESICWTSLKDLTLRHIPDNWDARPLWSQVWKRCGQLERLRVEMVDKSTPSLVQAMLAYMHNLQDITIGNFIMFDWEMKSEEEMKDDVVAALISGARHGWKTVTVGANAKLGRKTMNALSMHFSTLEQLFIDGNIGVLSNDLVQVLRSCPHLHTLRYSDMQNGRSVVGGMEFIDLDPDTGLLKPWLCERSLKMLELKIAPIPRPDLKNESVVAEAYPGQGREIQSQVYNRLGRLTHLETLKLGYRYTAYPYERLDMSLEMSLESGLDKLSGLKSLKWLDLEGLATNIGVNDLQWMVENWPIVRSLHIGWHEKDVEALTWLRENFP